MKLILDYIRTIPDYPVKGVNFYDMNSLFSSSAFKYSIKQLAKKIKKFKGPTHIVGVESRGFVVGSALSMVKDIPFLMVRKPNSAYPGELLHQKYNLEYGQSELTLQKGLLGHTSRCIIIDDLVATGGSIMATKSLVQQTGAKVLGAGTIIDLKYTRPKPIDIDVVSLIMEDKK